MTVATADPGIVRRVFREVLRSFVGKQQNTTGVMVALFLPASVAAELAQPGGIPADQLHLTLKVFADDASQVEPRDLDALAAAVQHAATESPVISGNVSGVGRFNGDQAGGGKDVTYATIDAPGLVDLFERISWMHCGDEDDQYLEGGDQPDHDFTPHVTLAYGTTDVPEVPTIPVRFDRLTLAIGSERREFLFAGAATAAPVTKAEWTAAYVNGLPDSAFAVVLPGGEKDADGLTTPRDLRKLPYRDDSGAVDAAHLRNALSRLPQSDLTDGQKAAAQSKLQAAMAQLATKALDAVAEPIAKAMGETGFLGDLEVDVVGLDPSGQLVMRAGGLAGELFVVKADGSGAFTTSDLASGGLMAPDQGRKRRRGAKTPAVMPSLAIAKYAVLKAAPSQRYTLGVAYPASDVGKAGPESDAHGEYMTPTELEKAAWRFMASGASASGTMHKDGTDGAGTPVESYIYRGPDWQVDDQVVKSGDWMLGVVWDEPTFAKVQSGELTGYSLQGYATREQ